MSKNFEQPEQQSFFIESPQVGKTLIVDNGARSTQELPHEALSEGSITFKREYDPNTRQAARQRENGVGGGIADGLDGELSGQNTETTPTSSSDNHLFEMPGIGKGRTNWYNNPMTDAAKLKGLNEAEIEAQKIANRRGREIADEIIRQGLK